MFAGGIMPMIGRTYLGDGGMVVKRGWNNEKVAGDVDVVFAGGFL